MKFFEKHISKIYFHLRKGEVEASIDGRILYHEEYGVIDLDALEKSLEKNGVYFIWTCDCGIPGCAGRDDGVKVSLKGKIIHWQDFDECKNYWFDRV